MKIEFSKLDYNILNNYRGGEGNVSAKIVLDANKKIMNFILQPHTSIGKHMHDQDEEVIYIVKGKATIIEECETYILNSGDVHISHNGIEHSIINDSDEELEIFSIVQKIAK